MACLLTASLVYKQVDGEWVYFVSVGIQTSDAFFIIIIVLALRNNQYNPNDDCILYYFS